MRIQYSKTGGVLTGGIAYKVFLDTSVMPQDEASEVVRLVASSGLYGASSGTSPSAADADVFSIRIAANDGSDQSWTFDTFTLPPTARPLVQFLNKRATPGPVT